MFYEEGTMVGQWYIISMCTLIRYASIHMEKPHSQTATAAALNKKSPVC